MAVVLGDGQLGQADDVARSSFELSPDLDLFPQPFRLLGEPLGSLGVLPDVRVG